MTDDLDLPGLADAPLVAPEPEPQAHDDVDLSDELPDEADVPEADE